MPPRRIAVALTIAASLGAAAPAHADEAIAEQAKPAPVAGYGGWSATSAYDVASGKYALVLRDPSGTPRRTPFADQSEPFDVALGPDAHKDVVAVARICAQGTTRCDVQRLNVASNTPQTLRTVSSPSYDESSPAIWGSDVVFTRKVRGCDVPYVKNLASPAPSRRLLKARGVHTDPGHTAIRGTRIVISSVVPAAKDRASRAELRTYSATKNGSEQILSQGFGEESNLFGQVALTADRIYGVRYGLHNPTGKFLRVAYSGRAEQDADSRRILTGAFAKPSDHRSTYVVAQDVETGGCGSFALVPCLVVQAPAIPFGGVERQLPPRLTVQYDGSPTAKAGQPVVFRGVLTRDTVSGDSLRSRTPVAGVTVHLRHRVGSGPERFDDTGLTATTAADGSYAITLPAAGKDPFYPAVADTPGVETWAGRGTVGTVGTVTP